MRAKQLTVNRGVGMKNGYLICLFYFSMLFIYFYNYIQFNYSDISTKLLYMKHEWNEILFYFHVDIYIYTFEVESILCASKFVEFY